MNESQLYQSFNVVMEMLEARGYNTTSTKETCTSLELSKIFLGSVPSSILVDNTVRIFYFNHSQYKKHLKVFKFEEEEAPIHMVILLEKINHTILKGNNAYKNFKIKCQIFHISDVMINISKHHLVPKHEVMSKKEEHHILSQYMATKVQLPWILKTDPMAKFLGLESGQIVKITHTSLTNGEYISYRTCV
jgi:DNA-directed RNA polymerase I, II, and III subunit RPABC1